MSRSHATVIYSFSATTLIGAAAVGPTLAQTAQPGLEQLPTVTVEGQASTTSAARPDLDPNNTANFARVAPSSRPHTETFTRADIEAIQPSDVYDLLSHATGVVPTSQGRKLGYNLMIRGDSNYGFIIDGAYVPIATAGRILQTLPVSAIEQIDIVRDSTALMLGPLVDFDSASGALNSGFIVIRTHRPAKTEAELRGAVESYGTLTASGYAGTAYAGGLNTPSAYVSGLMSQKRTDGPSGYNAWSNSTTGLLKGGISAGALETNWEVFQDHARYGFERAESGQSTSSLVNQRWSYAPIDTTLITSNSLFSWNAYTSTLLTVSYNAVSAQNVQASYSTPTVSVNQDKTYTVSTNLRQNIQFGHTLLQVGGEYVGYNSPTGQMFYAGYANAQQTLSGYVHGEQKFLDNRLTLDASARFDDHEILQGIDLYNQGAGAGTTTSTSTAGSGTGGGTGKGTGKTTSSTTTTTNTYQYFYNRTLPLAKSFAGGAAWQVVPQLLATGRYSHTEQGGITNILSATGAQLDPESQDKWEIGLEAPLASSFKPGFNFFDIKIDNDKIPTSYQTINGYQTPLWSESNTERRGFELIGQGLLATSALGQTNYRASWMHLTNVDSSSIAVYSATIPHDVVNTTLTQSWHEYSGTLALNYVSPYYSNFNSSDGAYHSVGNFVVVDMRLGRTFDFSGTQARLSVYGRNITDRKYETVYGFPSWGAVWGSELALTF